MVFIALYVQFLMCECVFLAIQILTYFMKSYYKMDELLIEFVRSHRVLFDIKSPNYIDQRMRQEAWEEIGRKLKIPPENAKDKWNKLRRCYSNALNRRRTKRSSEVVKEIIPWKFERQMNFLLPFLEIRKTHGHTAKLESEVLPNSDIIENANDEENDSDTSDKAYVLKNTNESDQIGEKESEDHTPATEALQNLKKYRHVRSTLNKTAQMIDVMKDNTKLKKANSENKSLQPKSISYPDLDETDMFFLSMARMTKQLPRYEQTQIKLTLSTAVLQAEILHQ